MAAVASPAVYPITEALYDALNRVIRHRDGGYNVTGSTALRMLRERWPEVVRAAERAAGGRELKASHVWCLLDCFRFIRRPVNQQGCIAWYDKDTGADTMVMTRLRDVIADGPRRLRYSEDLVRFMGDFGLSASFREAVHPVKRGLKEAQASVPFVTRLVERAGGDSAAAAADFRNKTPARGAAHPSVGPNVRVTIKRIQWLLDNYHVIQDMRLLADKK